MYPPRALVTCACVVVYAVAVIAFLSVVVNAAESKFSFSTPPDFTTTLKLNVSSVPRDGYVKASFEQGSLQLPFQAPLLYSMVTDALTDEQVFDGLDTYEQYLALLENPDRNCVYDQVYYSTCPAMITNGLSVPPTDPSLVPNTNSTLTVDSATNAVFNLSIIQQRQALLVDGVAVHGTLHCLEYQYYYIDIAKEVTSLVIQVSPQDEECHQSLESRCPFGVLYVGFNFCPTKADYTYRETFTKKGILSLNNVGTLTPGRYVIAVAADVFSGGYRQSHVVNPVTDTPEVVGRQCCAAPWQYELLVSFEGAEHELLYSGLFVIAIYACPVVATLMYSFWCIWERRTNAIKLSLGEAKPRADTNEFMVEMALKGPTDIPNADGSGSGGTPASPSSTSRLSTLGGSPMIDSSLSSDEKAPALKRSGTIAIIQKAQMANQKATGGPLFKNRPTRYYWAVLFAIGIFAGFPIVKFTLFEQKEYYSRNKAVCHFNELCKRDYIMTSFLVVEGFNNVFSNIGYVVCGAFLIFYVWWDRRGNPLYAADVVSKHGNGLLKGDQNLFYAQGVAIMMIGAFSGAYHICPTLNNYQYDTLFMFFLCGVSFAALYKRRHGAYFIRPVGFFLAFCLIFVVNTMGVWMKQNNFTWLFWLLYWPFFFVASFLFSLKVMYYKVVDFSEIFAHVYNLLCRKALVGDATAPPLDPRYAVQTRRFWLVTFTWAFMLISNAIAIPLTVLSPDLFLYMSFCLLWIYFVYYVGMKVIAQGEAVFSHVYIYASVAIVTVLIGLAGFLSNATRKEWPLHWSRTLNSKCWLLIFGSHDIWHFCSAFTVVFQALALYHLDDGAPTMERASVF